MIKDGYIETVFGRCFWSIEIDYAHVYNLFVNPEYRGKGIARHLLNRAISEIRDCGYTEPICIVSDPKDEYIDRQRLANFYSSMGFEVYEYYG